jgi:hypothetical protein
LTYDDTTNPPVLEIQVYHFSGIQAGLFNGVPVLDLDDVEGGGGCFIDTVTGGAPLRSLLSYEKGKGYNWLLALLSLISLAVCVWRIRRRIPTSGGPVFSGQVK